MLHCGSNAKVDRPLAFDSAPVAGSMAGVGVAQTHGWVCEPSSTGPPIAWLVMVSEARRPLESATKSLRPCTMPIRDRKSTRLNSSHSQISYAVFCLKKKKNKRMMRIEYKYLYHTAARASALA